MFDIIQTQTNVRNRCSTFRDRSIKMRREEKTHKNRILIRARLRRRNERYRNMLRFSFALIIAMIISTVSLSLRAFALAEDGFSPSYKCYTSYTVQSGDTLSSIASEYITDEYPSSDRYIAEVVSINHLLSASQIDEGQTIILPYYTSDSSN